MLPGKGLKVGSAIHVGNIIMNLCLHLLAGRSCGHLKTGSKSV